MTEDRAAEAIIATGVPALLLLAVATVWTWGLVRLGARWAPRAVGLVALLAFAAFELIAWTGSRPDVGPTALAWAGVAMPLLAAAMVTIAVLLGLTLVVAVLGIVRQVRAAPQSARR